MAKKYADTEKKIEALFKIGESFNTKNVDYVIDCVGKPTSSGGEPKTDVYISGLSASGEKKN